MSGLFFFAESCTATWIPAFAEMTTFAESLATCEKQKSRLIAGFLVLSS
jgi:hypothetical protein